MFLTLFYALRAEVITTEKRNVYNKRKSPNSQEETEQNEAVVTRRISAGIPVILTEIPVLEL
jgi:hypothetical protein